MALEFIGMIQPREQSEIQPARGPAIDPGYLVASAQAHEAHAATGGGFDRVLIGWHSNGPDGLQLAAHAAAHTKQRRLPGRAPPGLPGADHGGPRLRHARPAQRRPGRHPRHLRRRRRGPGARRRLARQGRPLRPDRRVRGHPQAHLDRGCPGRPRGRVLPHPGRLARRRTVQRPRIPIYFGGASDAAIRVAGRHADVYALWGETQAQVAEITGRVRAEAAKHGRRVGFSLSFRPILGATEDEAWAKAERILAQVQEVRGEAPSAPTAAPRPTPGPSACWTRRRWATGRKAASTPPSPARPAPAATPPPWSAPRTRWPRPSWSTTSSASTPS